MTAAATSLDVLEALDFEAEVPCVGCDEAGRTPRAAEWYLMRSCGCFPLPHCSPCRAHNDMHAAIVARRGGELYCHCRVAPVTFRYVPIKGGAE